MTTYTPRPGAKIRYAHYADREGFATIDQARTLLFRTDTTLWAPVDDRAASLVLLGELGDAETQRVLDAVAGGYGRICTSRRMEIQ